MLIGLSVVALAGLVWFAVREIRRSRRFFHLLSGEFNGVTTRLPFGMRFELQGIGVRIYALQGGIQYRATVLLRNDPGILVTRTYRMFKFLERMNFSPSREKFLFHTPVDQQYGFRAKNTRWMREIFDNELLDLMTATGRVTRIEIRRRVVRGALLMITQSDSELEKAKQSINILNRLVIRLSRSTLALEKIDE